MSNVRFALDVAFEAVFVAAGFFAGLAVPSEPGEAAAFDFVAYCFGGTGFGARHFVVVVVVVVLKMEVRLL